MQDAAAGQPRPRLKKTDGQVDWSRPAAAIYNQIRALAGWPKTYTDWLRPGGSALRLILEAAAVESAANDAPAGPAGQVLVAEGDRLLVAAGTGALRIERLQPAGKRVLSRRRVLARLSGAGRPSVRARALG